MKEKINLFAALVLITIIASCSSGENLPPTADKVTTPTDSSTTSGNDSTNNDTVSGTGSGTAGGSNYGFTNDNGSQTVPGSSTFLLSQASFFPPVTETTNGTWDPATGKVRVLKAGHDWQVNLSWRRISLVAGGTYYLLVNCSSPSSSMYTITLKQDVYPYTTYASNSVACDGTLKSIELVSPISDSAAQLALNFGQSVGEYTLGSSLTFSAGQVGPVPQIPDGAPIRQEIIQQDTPPSEYGAVVIWAQAATLTSSQSTTEKAVVTIDYWKFIENGTDGGKRVIHREDYDYSHKTFTTDEAGLYIRSPRWFYTDDHTQAFNMYADLGYLIIDAGKTPNNIVHWWSERRSISPRATYSAEIRFKVEGKNAVQFGSDWWRSLEAGYVEGNDCSIKNNCQAWVSGWYGDTGGQFLTVTVPGR